MGWMYIPWVCWPLKSTFACGNSKTYIRVLTNGKGKGLHKCNEAVTVTCDLLIPIRKG